eukprot:gene16983-23254_t
MRMASIIARCNPAPVVAASSALLPSMSSAPARPLSPPALSPGGLASPPLAPPALTLSSCFVPSGGCRAPWPPALTLLLCPIGGAEEPPGPLALAPPCFVPPPRPLDHCLQRPWPLAPARPPSLSQGGLQRHLAPLPVLLCQAPAPPALSDDEILAASIEIRVGKIVACELHPEADNLYVEQIDVGEEEPRTIVSGLVNFVPLEQMQGRKVVVICNLKGRNLKGIKSNGMVLCASDASHENVEVLSPPEEAPVGERVWFGEGNEKQEEAKTPNQLTKKKLWEQFQPDLKTNADKDVPVVPPGHEIVRSGDGEDIPAPVLSVSLFVRMVVALWVAGYKGAAMLTSAGPVTTASLSSAGIS